MTAMRRQEYSESGEQKALYVAIGLSTNLAYKSLAYSRFHSDNQRRPPQTVAPPLELPAS